MLLYMCPTLCTVIAVFVFALPRQKKYFQFSDGVWVIESLYFEVGHTHTHAAAGAWKLFILENKRVLIYNDLMGYHWLNANRRQSRFGGSKSDSLMIWKTIIVNNLCYYYNGYRYSILLRAE